MRIVIKVGTSTLAHTGGRLNIRRTELLCKVLSDMKNAGCQLVLFTTGRGTPFASPVPTVKIATNHSLAERKSNWIDFDASPTLDGSPLTDELFDYVISVAEGRETRNEINNYREISIFKDGVTL